MKRTITLEDGRELQISEESYNELAKATSEPQFEVGDVVILKENGYAGEWTNAGVVGVVNEIDYNKGIIYRVKTASVSCAGDIVTQTLGYKGNLLEGERNEN